MKKSRIIKDVILVLIIVIFIIISILSKSLLAGDEFINYYNTYKIFDGETIYENVNIISTPLLFYIGLLFFKLLGPSLIVFRLYNICINILIVLLIYKIFISLKIEKKHSIIYTLILEILIAIHVVAWGATYNTLGLLLCLMGLYVYLNRENIKLYNIKQGIIIFLIFMAKQNIGIYYIIGYILTEIIVNKKTCIKEILKTFVITIICISLYLIYLSFSGILQDFVNYTIFSINEFTKNTSIKGLGFIIIDIIIIIFIIFVLYKKLYPSQNYKNIMILFVFGICMLPIGYPLADKWHMIVASMILFICFIYVFHNNIILELNIKVNKVIIVILGLMVILSLYQLITCLNKICTDKNNKYYLIPNKNMGNRIEIMQEYLLETNNKVIIVSPEARTI